MPDQKPELPREQQVLEPRRCFTLFDVFHLSFTFGVALLVAVITGRHFGGLFGVIAFFITGVILFFVLGYAIAALVLFFYRRYSPNCKIGYEAGCYVISHFKRDA